LPFELVDDVLALNLFSSLGYARVWQKLTAGLCWA
jgi:hypothetical protein